IWRARSGGRIARITRSYSSLGLAGQTFGNQYHRNHRQAGMLSSILSNRFSGGFSMSFPLTPLNLRMFARQIPLAFVIGAAIFSLSSVALSQRDNKSQTQSGLSNVQRMDIMHSKLEAMRRSLESAISGVTAKDTGNKTNNADDPRARLRGLSKEVGSVLSEVNDLHAKEDHSEKYDASKLDGLETSVAELNTRVEAALTQTVGARTAGNQTSSTYQPKPEKGHRRMLGLLPGKNKNDKYAEITGSV